MDPHEPRRWLLVSQEHGVPDRGGATGDRWSLDHLFVDQDAVPTLVEVKRSTDSRIRREVVRQMMDYAANGVLYWPLDRLREKSSRTQRTSSASTPTSLSATSPDTPRMMSRASSPGPLRTCAPGGSGWCLLRT